MREHTTQVLAESRTYLAGKGTRFFQSTIKSAFVISQAKVFKRRLATRRIQTGEHEFAQVGHQHQTITVPVAGDLIAHAGRERILARRLDLDHPALRYLILPRPPFPHLPRRHTAGGHYMTVRSGIGW